MARLHQNYFGVRSRRGISCAQRARSEPATSFAGPAGVRETASSQNSPEISVGKARLRGRQTEMCTSRALGPVEKFKVTACQRVVPIVASLETSRHSEQAGSRTRRRGPLSEVMLSDRTNASRRYRPVGTTATTWYTGSSLSLCFTAKFTRRQRAPRNAPESEKLRERNGSAVYRQSKPAFKGGSSKSPL